MTGAGPWKAGRNGKPVARAIVPTIELKSAKFTRKLTTQWFAERVVTRHRACLARGGRVTAVPMDGAGAA